MRHKIAFSAFSWFFSPQTALWNVRALQEAALDIWFRMQVSGFLAVTCASVFLLICRVAQVGQLQFRDCL